MGRYAKICSHHPPEGTRRARDDRSARMSVQSLDGRHQRSARSREAVVDAMLDLLRERGEQPGAQEIADRAGVSLRTVFRHFDDVDSLFAAAVANQVQRVGGMFDPLEPVGPLTERVDALVRHRASLFEQIAPIRRAAQRRDENPVIGEWLGRSHDLLRGQMTTQLAEELQPLPARDRRVIVEALDAATSWPMWNTLRHDQQLDVEMASAVITHAILRLLDR